MGRRSINTTKSGKYMNPTDQARKEARKRELRKNKKQRMLVRTAVLKGKDPFQIIADLERLDQMEYNVNTPPPLNEKVLKDKRRKMKETWDRLCRLYTKEDHNKFLELKRMEVEYESKRNQLIKFYESVKSAQEVTIDDIPLPAVPMEATNTNVVNKPLSEQTVPQSILKKPNLTSQVSHNKTPPGVPPGPPPVLSDIEDDCDDDYDSDDDRDKSKKIRFSDETQANDKDSDINEFLKEIEQMEKSVNVNENLSQTVQSIQSLPTIGAHQSSSSAPTHSAIPPPPSLRAANVPSGPPPPSMMMFRPPVPPQSGIRSTSQTNIPGLMVPRPGMPGPPPPSAMRPGLPPHRMSVPLAGGPRMMPAMRPMAPHSQSTTFTAPPTLSKREDKNKAHFISDRATIEAKPQLRNLSADATRFTPVALRVKRDDKVVKKSVPKLGYDTMEFKRYTNTTQNSGLNAPSKDDAYDQFMKEMENLM